ncbi:fimbrial protein [Acinetobacter bereziniae]|uniref:fimbrial protein n=1 Tax=Acinetobacter bereziniae TaxID=106648 RepID=UPI00301663F0
MNKTRHLIYGLNLMFLTTLHHVSYAQDPAPRFDTESININLSGNVTEFTCSVASSAPVDKIELGTVLTKELLVAGNQSTPVPIRFELSNCPPNGTVTISFTGTSDPTDVELLAINNTSNKAENVAIEIRDQNKKRLALGQKSNPFIADTSGNALAIFYANYISTQSPAKAGHANAKANFSIEYQ